ncbi:MAG: protein kinase [Myxococcota bacterium]
MSEPSLDDTIEAAVATLQRVHAEGIDPEGVDPRGTLLPKKQLASAALDLLGTADRYAMESTLGEGGMGIVHLAAQRTLGRDVAIKTLKPEHQSEHAMMRLLQEAWVTGTLEHPNVVPVYDIDRDAQGFPRIVLKKIEGQEWASLMGDAAAVRSKFRANDLLEWNLQIVLDVCQALRFAHSRGFVHRDLKPENVMVGSFGEVYVLDWGIAVAMNDDGTGRFPLARDATEMAGTPCYMAPEQLGGEESRIAPTTDVYLVGAMLFEMLTGQVPHPGTDLNAIVASILSSPPRLPTDVPEELARIVKRAMAADPDARFETVEQLHLALEGFLRHRGSRQLATQARERGRELVAAMEAGDEDAIEALYAECTFGYRAALRAWRENEDARAQLRQVTLLRVEHELERGELGVVERLLKTMDAPPASLRERVSALREKQRAEGEAVRRLQEDVSQEIGRRTRTLLGFVVTAIWTLSPLGGLVQPFSLTRLALGMTVIFSIILGLAIWARDSMMRTRLNRQLGGAVIAALATQLLVLYASWMLEIDMHRTEVLVVLVWTMSAAFTTIILPGVWPAIVGFGATLVVVSLFPDWRYPAMSLGNAVLMVTILWQNRAISLLRDIRRQRHGTR